MVVTVRSERAVTPRKDRKGVECGLSPASVQEMSPESRLERPRFVYTAVLIRFDLAFDFREIRIRAPMAPSVSVSVRASRPTPLLRASRARRCVSSNPVRFFILFVTESSFCILIPVLRCKK